MKPMKRKDTDNPDDRCAICPFVSRWHIWIPKTEDQEKFIKLYQKSGAKGKNNYTRGPLLNEPFKVIIEDKSADPCLKELNRIIALMRSILYNEAVKTLNNYHTAATTQRMIR